MISKKSKRVRKVDKKIDNFDKRAEIVDKKIEEDEGIEIEFVDTSALPAFGVPESKYKTNKVMTQYEYIALWSARAKQLKIGMPAKVEWTGVYDPIAIAKEEIKQGVVPLMIKRRIPDENYEGGYKFEYWDIADMDVRDH